MCPIQKRNSGGKLEGKLRGVFWLTELTPRFFGRNSQMPLNCNDAENDIIAHACRLGVPSDI